MPKYVLATNEGHSHRATLDRARNGQSTTNEGHSHKVNAGRVRKSEGHVHSLRRVKV